MKLYDFMMNPQLCGLELRHKAWSTWRIIARLGDAALLTPEECVTARQLIGREALPTDAPRKLFIGAGRRSGKTRFDAVLAVHAAALARRRDCSRLHRESSASLRTAAAIRP